MDIVTLGAARAYVQQTAKALGAVKGSPCTVKSITEDDNGATVVFAWTGTDGKEQTSTTYLPRGPQGVQGEQGDKGDSGISPEIDVVAISGGHRVTITDANGTQTFDVMDGVGGSGGTVEVDTTLAEAGKAADAKAAGDRLNELSEEIAALKGEQKEPASHTPDQPGALAKNGTISTLAVYVSNTGHIPLEGYSRVLASTFITGDYYALAFFDDNQTLMQDVSVIGTAVNPQVIDMEVPTGAAYCMLSLYYHKDNLYYGQVTLYPEVTSGKIAGKKIAFLGDSISSTNFVTPNYWQLISSKTGCEPLNYSVSQSSMASVAGASAQSFVTRAANMDATADAVVVMGGTNDVGYGALLGEWDSADESTFYGALNALIALLRAKYPGKPIVFCTPIKRKQDTDNGFPVTMADLKATTASTAITMQHCVLAIKAKCAQHGIPVVDLADHSGIAFDTPEYYRAADDNLHPSALGHVRIANMVQPELEKQFLHTAD